MVLLQSEVLEPGKVASSVSGLLKDATKVKVPFTPPTTNSRLQEMEI